MLQLSATFDLQQDVVSSIFKKEATVGRTEEYSGIVDTRILNIERDGGVLYSWKGATGTTRIGKYDPNTRQNKLLYTFDKQVCVSSCSLNKEETLLVSKCLTLLIEIHPINNTKVLKAVDCRVRVQFIHPDTERDSVLESHLLLVAEDGYVEQLHVMLVRQEGYRVVMLNPECLAKDRVAEEFSWVQWDSQTQRLFYLTHREKAVLKCVQFYHDQNCETLFELELELPSNPFTCMRFVNLGFDHHQETQHEREEMRMLVITNKTEGSMCVCYSQPACANQEITYTIVLVHRGCSKTFSVALDGTPSPCSTDLLPLFIPIGYYVVVYLAGHFLHCINTRQQELLCHSLFLSGVDAELGVLGSDSVVLSLPESSLLDLNTGRMYTVDLNPSFLMDLLHCSHSRPDAQRLAALHCLLLYMGPNAALQLKIIDWICDNVMPFDTFDQIQEFILASLYRIIYKKCLSLDEVLPYSSVFEKKKVPEGLDLVPGVTCTTELHAEPVFKGKARRLQGYWEELQWSTEKMKYFEAVPNLRYRASQSLSDWTKLLTTLKSENKKASNYLRHIEENTKQVLSMVDSWNLDQKVVPLFQEQDSQQRALIGLMVDKLREHLNRHLPRLGKKKIDVLVVNYVAKLLELIRRMLQSVWLKYKLGPLVLCLKQQGSSAEWAVFHVMCRILEATNTLCLPLPPGYHTLLSVLGVRCLPRHTFLQYVDHGVLQLTETFVSRLMTDLDNNDANEELKFSILKRLPEPMEQRICHLWDHPISSACISRDYVRGLLEKHAKTKGSMFMERDEPGFRPEFLPLTFLTKILLDVEDRALNPFEEQENVDARFVEETALKQTLILLGFQDK
ncbi:gamma-secretase-activating protein isoform X3 [Salmo salar]|uniref:Gamma-secretase-activating protein isoform X3 n=2 Tax=Salmo salar TaxID=8030 RepID=A0ABM3DBQ2_SALSA|nr:gamma-secretase-activating protein-like isoform X3 [Salmo salar]